MSARGAVSALIDQVEPSPSFSPSIWPVGQHNEHYGGGRGRNIPPPNPFSSSPSSLCCYCSTNEAKILVSCREPLINIRTSTATSHLQILRPPHSLPLPLSLASLLGDFTLSLLLLFSRIVSPYCGLTSWFICQQNTTENP